MGNWFWKDCEIWSSEQKKRAETANKRVIVYVWTTQSLGGRGKSGHVSVEITVNNKQGTLEKHTYISLWPVINLTLEHWPLEKARPEFECGDRARWCLIKDYTSDRLLEKRKPEYVFCFYDLDTTKIIHAFKTFKRDQFSFYHRMGQYVQKVESEHFDDEEELKEQGKPTYQSCVSMACLTLDAGGINKWLTRTDEMFASSKGTSEVSAIQSEDAFGHFRNLNIIQPSKSVAFYILEQLVSGYIMSPDVLAGRLKIVKRKEWEAKESIRRMGRFTATTKVSLDGRERKVEYSHQDINSSKAQPVKKVVHPEVDDQLLEWLPMDERISYSTAVIITLLFALVAIVALCVPQISN